MQFIPPFDDAPGLVRFVRGTVQRGKDMMMASEGDEGSGKSTTTAHICKNVKPSFDLRRDTIKDLNQLLEIMEAAKKCEVYDLDEAVNIFHNQDWASWEARDLSKIIRQMRVMESFWGLNIPDFDGLHPYVREARTRIRIYHPPVYDSEGFGNGPSQVFFRHSWFSFKEQRVVRRWQMVIPELHVESLDHTKSYQGYELDKIENFRELVRKMQKRRAAEEVKKQRASSKGGSKSAKKKTGKAPRKPLTAKDKSELLKVVRRAAAKEADESPPLLRRGGAMQKMEGSSP